MIRAATEIHAMSRLVALLFTFGLASCARTDARFAPLVNGSNSAQFEYHSIFMADGARTEKLSYGPLHMQSLSTDDLRDTVNPLIDKMMRSGRITLTTLTSDEFSTINAVFFLVSIHPNILIAVPEEPITVGHGVYGYVYRAAMELGRNTIFISYRIAAGECSSDAKKISNSNCQKYARTTFGDAVTSRVFFDRNGAMIISENMETPVELSDHFETGGIKFGFVPVAGVAGMNGYLEARIIHQ